MIENNDFLFNKNNNEIIIITKKLLLLRFAFSLETFTTKYKMSVRLITVFFFSAQF